MFNWQVLLACLVLLVVCLRISADLQLGVREVGGQLCGALGVLGHVVLLRVLALYLAAQPNAVLPAVSISGQPDESPERQRRSRHALEQASVLVSALHSRGPIDSTCVSSVRRAEPGHTVAEWAGRQHGEGQALFA